MIGKRIEKKNENIKEGLYYFLDYPDCEDNEWVFVEVLNILDNEMKVQDVHCYDNAPTSWVMTIRDDSEAVVYEYNSINEFEMDFPERLI